MDEGLIGSPSHAPDVSVVMSVYNAREHLRDAMDSILTQEGVSLEFVIVDDGSTDGSAAVLREYAARDARVRVISQSNAGLTKALIRGCAEARGEFIARQDSDDRSLPGRLAAQLAVLRSDPAIAFVSSSAEVIGPRNEVLLQHLREHSSEEATALVLARRIGPPGHGSVMFRRAAYERAGGYRAQLYFAQDNDLWLRLAAVGRLAYVPAVLYQYRIAPDSISGRLHPVKLPFAAIIAELQEARESGADEAAILERAAALPRRANESKRDSSHQTSYFIARCLLKRSDRRALGYLLDTLRENPLYLRAWPFLPFAAWLAVRQRQAS